MLNLNTPRPQAAVRKGAEVKEQSALFDLLIKFDVNKCIPFTCRRGFRVRRKKKGAYTSRSWSWCSDVISEVRGGLGGVRSGCVGRVESVWGGLTAGQAAHLTVLCARLVHEGAVEAGPHGRGGGWG